MPSPRTVTILCRIANVLSVIVLMVFASWVAFKHHDDDFGRNAFFIFAAIWVPFRLGLDFVRRRYGA